MGDRRCFGEVTEAAEMVVRRGVSRIGRELPRPAFAACTAIATAAAATSAISAAWATTVATWAPAFAACPGHPLAAGRGRCTSFVSAMLPRGGVLGGQLRRFRQPREVGCEGGSEDAASVRAAAQSMRVAEIKRELEAAGVGTADVFDKDGLVDRLVQLRLGEISGAATEAVQDAPSVEPSASASATGGAAAAAPKGDDGRLRVELLERCRAMKVKELRTELGTRGVPWADALEKNELVERLLGVFLNEEVAKANFCRSGRIVPGAVVMLTGAELDEELKDSSTPLLLDVYATWCGPCQMMAPHLEAAARKLGPKCRVAKIDSDKDPQWASRLRVGALPTVILFGKDGKEVKRQEGAMMEQQLINLAEKAL